LPAYKAGGPVRSVANLIENLKNDFEFKIVTGDRDLGDTSPFKDVKTNSWIQKDDYQIMYLSPEQNKEKIKAILINEKYDKVYLNSLFSKDFTLFPLYILKKLKKQNKVVLAPRGMLGEGALAVKSVKKKIFLKGAKLTGLFKNITWHATTNDEVKSIKKHFGDNSKVVEIQNFSRKAGFHQNFIAKNPKELKLVFLSRILPIKNLDFAVSVLKQFDKQGIAFDIYGSIEDAAYWQKLQEEINSLKNIQVSYKGELHPENVVNTLSQYHYLFLPTKHENFGHVIAEALSAGCGVLLSDQTPWCNLQEYGVGYDFPLKNPEKFVEALNEIYNQNQEQFNETRKKALNFADKLQDNSQRIKQYKKLFS
tara:strand:+ start:167148 stop:168245 length:1098 start_codon:yes stop_codon:yes gene_type:complete